MLNELLNRLLASEVTGDGPGSLQLVLLSSCLEPYGNDLVLVFAGGEKCPGHVMKMARDPAFNRKIVTECRVLRHLSGRPELKGRAPVVTRHGRLNDRAFIIERGLGGSGLFNVLLTCRDIATVDDLLLQASRLLAELNQLPSPSGLGLDLSGNSLSYSCRDLLEASASFLSPRQRDTLNEAWADLVGLSQSYFLHGDYWPTNILLDDSGRISGLIDWEFAAPSSPIPSDIGWFLVNAAHVLALGSEPAVTMLEAFRKAFFGGWRGTGILRSVCTDYLSRIGFEVRAFERLLGVTLLQMAHRERCAYGRHGTMDGVCRGMLLHLLQNSQTFTVG